MINTFKKIVCIKNICQLYLTIALFYWYHIVGTVSDEKQMIQTKDLYTHDKTEILDTVGTVSSIFHLTLSECVSVSK